MFGEEEEEGTASGSVRYPVMPSLVTLQQMRNRLHLAKLGKKLMKWTAVSTGKELRRIASNIVETYRTFDEDVSNAFMLLARARYFCPELNKITLSNLQKGANVKVTSYTKAVAGVRVKQFVIIEDKKPYVHLGISEGGQSIQEAKDAWLQLLKKIIMTTQLRINFHQVDVVDKSAKKKQNVLSKIVIPRILVTISYILSELEEREREETFRLKRIKQKKIKENEAVKKDTKKDICCCGTDIRESEKEIKKQISKKSFESKSEYIKKLDQCKSAEIDQKIKELVSNIANVIKSTEQIKVDLAIPSLNRLLDTCNEIKDKIEHSTKSSFCVACKKNMLDEVAVVNIESLKTPSRTCTSLLSPAPSIKRSSSVKCTHCMKNLQDVVTTMDIEPLKTISQPCTIRSESSSSNFIKPTCQSTCGLEYSSTPPIKPFEEETNKLCTVRCHLCDKNLQEKVVVIDEKPLTIPPQSSTKKLVPSVLDSTKSPCQAFCESVPFSYHSIKPDCKESIRAIEQPMATYELSPESDDQTGYFEKKFKEIVRVIRLQNEDGTISEEKQVITIKTERKNPRKEDDCVTSGTEFGSNGRCGWGGGASGKTGHSTSSNYSDFGSSNCQNYYQRQTKSEYTNRNNTMGNPKVRECKSAENQNKATTGDTISGCDNSCYLSTNSSRLNKASEPQIKSRLVPGCIEIPVQLPVDDRHINSKITFQPCISNVQLKTNTNTGVDAIWRDAYTSTTDLMLEHNKMPSLKSAMAPPHFLKCKYSCPDNSINDEGIENKPKKKAKVSHKDDYKCSSQEVVLKGSLLDAIKNTYLPQTTTRFSQNPLDSKQKENYCCNNTKSILNKISQKSANKSEKPICSECNIKLNISSSNKPCLSILQKRSGGSYPSQYSWSSQHIGTKSYGTPSAESVCAMCQASQQELELQSSSQDDADQSISSYMSCRSVAIECSGEMSKESITVCCNKGRKPALVSPNQSQKCSNNCGLTKQLETSSDTSDKITKKNFEVCCKKASKKALVSPKQSHKHNCGINKEFESSPKEIKQIKRKITCEKASVHSQKSSCKAKQCDKCKDTDDDDQNVTNCCKLAKDVNGLESQSKSEKNTKDAGTSTNRSSRYDVRPAKLHFGDKIKEYCACQSDTQILKNRFTEWLPIKPIHKCKSMGRQ